MSASHAYEGGLAWRPIPTWPEYEVSEFGDVRRVQGGQGTWAGRARSPYINVTTGYPMVDLWRGNKVKKIPIHRLVALAFIGMPPSPRHVVAHNDGSRNNNHWSNLRWATQRENVQDTLEHGTHNRGIRNGQAKLDEICVLAIRRMISLDVPRLVAADGFGITRQAVDDIINRRRWRHLP